MSFSFDPALLLWIPALLLVLLGLAGLAVPALPGAPLLFAGLLLAAWAEDFVFVGGWTLGVLGVLALLTYAVDFIAGAFGAKRFGASGRAIVGATLGAIVGIFFGIFGILLGPFIGAAIAEYSVVRNVSDAGRAGYGATIGLVLGVAAKLTLAFAMIGLFTLARLL